MISYKEVKELINYQLFNQDFDGDKVLLNRSRVDKSKIFSKRRAKAKRAKQARKKI